MPPRVAIVGAGIGGLAAAGHLRRRAAEQGRAIEIVLLEASDRAGGLLATELCEGALLEHGPDTLVTHKPAGLALCERLGLGSRLVFPPAGRIEILHRGRLVPVPAGFALLVPTRKGPMLSSPLLSWRGKLRLLAAPLLGSKAAGEAAEEPVDESVASFVRRRFGAEVHARLSEPIVGGIYMADTERLSLAAAFPRLAQLASTRPVRSGRPRVTGAPAGGQKPPAATLDGGLGQIADALVALLPPGALRLESPVLGLRRDTRGFVLDLPATQCLAADAVLVAVPAHRAAPLLRELDPSFADEVGRIAYASCVTVHLGWPRRAIARPPASHGFFVPRTAGLPFVAAGFPSVKFPERVEGEQVVARVFLGGALHPEVEAMTDGELVALSASTLAPLLGLREGPAWSRVWRHPSALPQRSVGHPALAARLQARLGRHPGLDFAGGPLGAYGVPDSIAAGEAAAERLLGSLLS